ncbi:hypothetical protein [Bacillus thuringiensis]|uniref:hypothetical protein n=1 Tax=Bacillus thuringiensis TaxID=1428 RepID=UPI000D04224C|nr:hypothetical protein [Bacillus thuringiensis]PRT32159.1 hypothetical protein C6351_01365 [Bacillus thuringiensis]
MQKIKELFIQFISDIIQAFHGINKEVAEYLSWTSALIVPLVVLVTIIFTQYNDKVIQKSNELIFRIQQNLLDFTEQRLPIITSSFDELSYLAFNARAYKQAMLLFKWGLFLLTPLWIISCIRYLTMYNSFLEIIIIIIATILLSGTLIYLPTLFDKFNKTEHFQNNANELSSFETCYNFIKKMSNQDDTNLINNFINPKVSIGLIDNKHIQIALDFPIAMSDLQLIYSFQDTKRNRILIPIKLDSTKGTALSQKRYHFTLYSADNTQLLNGLFELLKDTRDTKSHLHFASLNDKIHFRFNLRKKIDSNNIQFEIGEIEVKSLTLDEKAAKESQKCLVKKVDSELSYVIEQKKL